MPTRSSCMRWSSAHSSGCCSPPGCSPAGVRSIARSEEAGAPSMRRSPTLMSAFPAPSCCGAFTTFPVHLAGPANTSLRPSAAAPGRGSIAGYGVGWRLEYLLVALVFGLGAPLVALVGTNIGAGNRDRALRVAWTGAAIGFVISETIGLWAAVFPGAWLSLFGDDQQMIAAGSAYLRVVGPFYGFFGLGLALYFSSQGAGRLLWPLCARLLRLPIAVPRAC